MLEKFNDDKKFELASQVASNAKRLLSLISNLLDVARSSGGKMFLDLKKVDLNLLIEDMIDECQTLYTINKKINFKFKKGIALQIEVDKGRISQILRNLFVNAIKFSPDNSTITAKTKLSRITYENGKKTEALLFMLEDQGVGIPNEELNLIFLPFTQSTKTKSKSGGIGLGLTICKDIINAHNGQIWAENLPEGGTRFNFLLPLIQSEISDTSSNLFTKEKILGTNNIIQTEPANILMIDDEEACLISMELLLNGTNHKLVTKNTSHDGLTYLKNNSNKIDIIFLDLMMPGVEGMNIIEKIKSDPRTKNIPIIIQSGISDEGEINQAYQYGIQSYIKKPYDRATVLNEIHRILVNHQEVELG